MKIVHAKFPDHQITYWMGTSATEGKEENPEQTGPQAYHRPPPRPDYPGEPGKPGLVGGKW